MDKNYSECDDQDSLLFKLQSNMDKMLYLQTMQQEYDHKIQ